MIFFLPKRDEPELALRLEFGPDRYRNVWSKSPGEKAFHSHFLYLYSRMYLTRNKLLVFFGVTRVKSNGRREVSLRQRARLHFTVFTGNIDQIHLESTSSAQLHHSERWKTHKWRTMKICFKF